MAMTTMKAHGPNANLWKALAWSIWTKSIDLISSKFSAHNNVTLFGKVW
jgi:hypothetical protein